MIPIFFVLFMFLDFQRPETPKEGIEKQFFMSQLVDETLINCATNGPSGVRNDDPITVDWINQRAAGPQSASPSNGPLHVVPLIDTNDHREWVIATSGSSVRDGTASSPNPSCPPAASTPEPSTLAILGITAASLLFLLFGHRQGRRLFRRI